MSMSQEKTLELKSLPQAHATPSVTDPVLLITVRPHAVRQAVEHADCPLRETFLCFLKLTPARVFSLRLLPSSCMCTCQPLTGSYSSSFPHRVA